MIIRTAAQLLLSANLVAAMLAGMAFAEEAANSYYTIPAELTPVSK